jgi:CheY-specific phosphatase CheX
MRQGNAPLGAFIAAFDRSVLIKILNIAPDSENIDVIDDAVCEMTNMLYGVFKTSVNNEGYRLAMGLPTLIREPETDNRLFDRWEKLCFPFSVDGKKCWVAVTQHD